MGSYRMLHCAACSLEEAMHCALAWHSCIESYVNGCGGAHTVVPRVVHHNRGQMRYWLTSNGRRTPQQCQHLVTQLLLPLVSEEACAHFTGAVKMCP